MGSSINILQIFITEKLLYERLNSRITDLINTLLKGIDDIRVHHITNRVKDSHSLERKINSKNKYTSLDDITDLSGVRIICYFEDDVDKIASIIEREFDIDWDNSVDKRKLKDNQFGYKSLHYVVKFNSVRTSLPEYSEFTNKKTEIQIRSILQHAWAEIEHDLGYKSTQALPYIYRRSFSRVAALLETADIEFSRLRKELSDYEADIPKLFEGDLTEISIDKPAVEYLFLNDKDIRELEDSLAEITEVPLEDKTNDTDILLSLLNRFGINNIGDLKNIIFENKAYLLDEAHSRKLDKRESGLSGYLRGVSGFRTLFKLMDDEKKRLIIE